MEYRLFAANKEWMAKASSPPESVSSEDGKKKRREDLSPVHNTENYRWSVTVPILARAMVLGDRHLFIAGPDDVLEEKGKGEDKQKEILAQEAALLGRSGGTLWSVSAEDGAKLAEYRLESPPIFDGMAIAQGRLFISQMNGVLTCWE
jgi:hypothetical protein